MKHYSLFFSSELVLVNLLPAPTGVFKVIIISKDHVDLEEVSEAKLLESSE